jgi:hypothetical protein
MTQQLTYQAIVCVLSTTLTISKKLDTAKAKQVKERALLLENAACLALKTEDGQALRALCDEVVDLGNEVKRFL